VQVSTQVKLSLLAKLIIPLVIFDPTMVQHLLDGGSAAWILVQSHPDEVLSFFRCVLQEGVVWLVLDNIIVDAILRRVLVAAGVERWRSSQQDVGNDTCSPAINFEVIRFLFNELRRHVNGTTQRKRLLLVGIILGCKSKICQLDVDLIIINIISVLFAQEILRLKISMHNVLLVHEVEGKKQLFDNMGSLRLGKL